MGTLQLRKLQSIWALAVRRVQSQAGVEHPGNSTTIIVVQGLPLELQDVSACSVYLHSQTTRKLLVGEKAIGLGGCRTHQIQSLGDADFLWVFVRLRQELHELPLLHRLQRENYSGSATLLTTALSADGIFHVARHAGKTVAFPTGFLLASRGLHEDLRPTDRGRPGLPRRRPRLAGGQ